MFDPLILVLGPGGAAAIVLILGALLASPLFVGVADSYSDDVSGQIEALSRRWRSQPLSARVAGMSANFGSWLRHRSPCAAVASFCKARLPRRWH